MPNITIVPATAEQMRQRMSPTIHVEITWLEYDNAQLAMSPTIHVEITWLEWPRSGIRRG